MKEHTLGGGTDTMAQFAGKLRFRNFWIVGMVLLVMGLATDGAVLAQEKIKLRVAHMHGPSHFAARWESQLKFDEWFMAKYPHIEIERVAQPGGSLDWFVVNAAAGTLPDIFYVTWSQGHTLAQNGITLDLTPFIQRDVEFDYDDIFPIAQAPFLVDGGIYGIAFDAGAIIPYYHGDLLAEAGLAPPSTNWTLDDLLEYARRLTRTRPDNTVEVYGLARYFDEEVINAALGVFGGAILNDEETASLISSPESVAALEWWSSLAIEHGVAIRPGIDYNQVFVEGNAAMTFGGSWMLDWYTARGETDRNTNVTAFPRGPVRQTASIAGSGYGISRTTEHPEAAWTYLREFMGKENFHAMWARDGSPARRSAWPTFAEIWLERNPEINIYAFMEAMDYGEYIRPLGSHGARVIQVVQEGIGMILHEELSPLAGAQRMHELITAVLSSED